MSSGKRVLVIAYTFPAPSETFIVDHLRGLLAYGWEPAVAAWEFDPPGLATLQERHGVAFPLLRISGPRWPRSVRLQRLLRGSRLPFALWRDWVKAPDLRELAMAVGGLRGIMREHRPDLVHAHFGPLGAAAALALTGQRTPLLVDFHGFDATVVPRRSGWRTYRGLRYANAELIAHSAFIAGLIRILDLPVHRVPMGFDSELFHPECRRPEGWPRPLRMAVIGRLVPQKGQSVALEAMRALLDRGVDARLTLVGDGGIRDMLERYARLLGLEPNVRFLPTQTPSELALLLESTDVLLAPGIRAPSGAEEGFGRAALEGVGAGVPVVAFPTGGLPEAVGSGGLIVSRVAADALADGVLDLMAIDSPAGWQERCAAHAKDRSLTTMWEAYDRAARRVLATIAA